MNPQINTTGAPNEAQQGIVGSVFGWLAHPFSTQGSALTWVLFVGVLVVAAWFWQHTLLSILDEA